LSTYVVLKAHSLRAERRATSVKRRCVKRHYHCHDRLHAGIKSHFFCHPHLSCQLAVIAHEISTFSFCRCPLFGCDATHAWTAPRCQGDNGTRRLQVPSSLECGAFQCHHTARCIVHGQPHKLCSPALTPSRSSRQSSIWYFARADHSVSLTLQSSRTLLDVAVARWPLGRHRHRTRLLAAWGHAGL